MLQFSSETGYKLANFGSSEQVRAGKTVYVSGSPEPSQAIPQRTLLVTEGNIVGIQEPQNGYTLIYDNSTRRGMSGGAVLDENGRVIGIHGQGDEQDGNKVGLNLGIPIQVFLDAPKPEPKPSPSVSPSPKSTVTEKQVSSPHPISFKIGGQEISDVDKGKVLTFFMSFCVGSFGSFLFLVFESEGLLKILQSNFLQIIIKNSIANISVCFVYGMMCKFLDQPLYILGLMALTLSFAVLRDLFDSDNKMPLFVGFLFYSILILSFFYGSSFLLKVVSVLLSTLTFVFIADRIENTLKETKRTITEKNIDFSHRIIFSSYVISYWLIIGSSYFFALSLEHL